MRKIRIISLMLIMLLSLSACVGKKETSAGMTGGIINEKNTEKEVDGNTEESEPSSEEDVPETTEEERNEQSDKLANPTSSTNYRKGVGIAEYDGIIYTIGDSVGELQHIPYEPEKYDTICNIVFYQDRLYYSCKSAGTSEISSAIFTCKPDGSDVRLIDDCEFSYDKENFDCQNFVISGDLLFYDGGMRTYHLPTGTKDVRSSNIRNEPNLQEAWKWAYDHETNLWYTIEDNVIYERKGTESEAIYYPARSQELVSLLAVIDGKLYFESYWSEAQKKYLMGDDNITEEDKVQSGYLSRLDLRSENKSVEEIDHHMVAGGGAYFNY